MNSIYSTRFEILKLFYRIIMSQGNDRVFYAVGLGRERGIFNSWRECKVQVEGITNAKFKKFFTYEEAQEFVNFWKNHPSAEVESVNLRVSTEGGNGGLYSGYKQHYIPQGKTAVPRLTKAGTFWSDKKFCKAPVKKKNSFVLGAPNGKTPSDLNHEARNFSTPYVSPINQTQDTFKFPIKVEEDSTNETSHDIQTLSVVKIENSTNQDNEEGNRKAPSLTVTGSDQAKSQSEKSSGESIQKLTELTPDRTAQGVSQEVNRRASPPGLQTQGSQREKGDNIECSEKEGSEILQKCLQQLGSTLRLLSKGNLTNSKGTLNSLRHFLKQLTGSTNDHVHPQVNTEEENSQREASTNEQGGRGLGEDLPGDREEPMEGLERQLISSKSSPKSSSSFLMSSPFPSRKETTNIEVAALNLRLDAFEKRFDLCLKEVGGILSELTHIKEDIKDVKESIRKAVAAGFGPSDSKNNASLSRDNQKQNGNSSLDVREPTTSRFLSVDSDEEPAIKRPKLLKRAHTETKFEECDNIDLVKVKTENAHLATFMVDSDEYVQVYTDGACIDNGKKCAKAGIGIYFGDDHPMNTSARAKGPQTNNNAEIQAARVAIQLAIEAGLDKVRISTDSEFLINCATKWIHKWKKNGWNVVDGGQVKNRKELEKLDWFASKISVRWKKVEAHKGIKGNEEADRLAREGANKSPG